jgi:phosphoglycolate phosphatase-like HAD superfamily hydrolase
MEIIRIALVVALAAGSGAAASAEELPSWKESASRAQIVSFVERVTKPGGPDFVAPPERIAVFDNDGTLWSEQPLYFQALFAIDRVKQQAARHPEWRTTQPFQAIVEGDHEAFARSGTHGLLEVVMATHAGMTTDEFARIVRTWVETARHPTKGRPYTELVFQPMLELLAYLRANGFRTYIVSGGGIEFMRVFAEEVYGIPPEQVIGSTITTEFALTEDGPVIRRLPEMDFIDDGGGKPVAINKFIGRRPIFAFGNSDGDQQMLQWTCSRPGPSLCGLVHHTDAEREWAYDRDSHVGRLDAALAQAGADGWTVVDMAQDWRQISP